MQELKEPLISQETKNNIREGHLKSYFKDLYPSQYKSEKKEEVEENHDEENPAPEGGDGDGQANEEKEVKPEGYQIKNYKEIYTGLT